MVADEIARLPAGDRLSIAARMLVARRDGLKSTRHLDQDIYEVEAHGVDNSYRLLFAQEGRKGRILLALVLFPKKTQKTPPRIIELAKQRRDDWRRRQ